MSAPEGYVQATLRKRRERLLSGREVNELPYPSFSTEQLLYLASSYPPKCIGHQEAVETHLRYAGKVELVEDLMQRQANHDQGELLVDGDYGDPIHPLSDPDAEHV